MREQALSEKALLQAARHEGLLPDNAKDVLDQPEVSWVVTVVSLVGAQFAVWPFMALLAIFGQELFFKPPGSFVMSALLISLGVPGLRQKNGHFVEHLCFTALLVGLTLLAFSVGNLQNFEFRRLNLMLLLVAAVEIAVAFAIRVVWVQRLLGFMAALLLMLVYFGPQHPDYFMRLFSPPTWNATALALVWCAWCVLEPHWSARRPGISRHVAALAEGVGLALLCFVLLTSGSFLTGQGLFDSSTRTGSADLATAGTERLFHFSHQVLLQLGLVLASAAFLLKHADLLQAGRRRDLALLCIVYAGLLLFGFFIRDGGVVVLVGTVALATGRKRLLALAVLVLLAQLSGFYYALGWPLVEKASVLVAAGAVLVVFLASLRWYFRQPVQPASAAVATVQAKHSRWATGLIAACAVLSLGVVNYDVAKKERVISQGKKIYLRIVPRDPRSLMQGDYMALAFDFPGAIVTVLNQPDRLQHAAQDPKRVLVVAKLDERGIATVVRLGTGNSASLANDELLLPLKHINGNWVVVTDAFFFAEGKGAGLRAARFGEFRTLPDGQALLIGLVDENLQAIND